MGDLVHLPQKEERRIWVCNCGCQTHYATDTGEIECAHCGTVASNGFWHVPDETDADTDPPDAPVMTQLVDLDSPEMALRRMFKLADPEKLRCVVLLQADGRIRFWGGGFEDRESRGWLRRQLEAARKALVGG